MLTLSMQLSDLSRDPKTTFFAAPIPQPGLYTLTDLLALLIPVQVLTRPCVNCHQIVLGNIDVSYCYRVPMDVESTPPLPWGSFTMGGGVLTP